MQTNKLLKSLLVAVPALTMMACGSTTAVDNQVDAEKNNTVVTDTSSGVQLSPAVEMVNPQEQIRKQIKQVKGTDVTATDAVTGPDASSEYFDDLAIYFDFDRASVRSEDFEVLDAHAAFLIGNPSWSVVIEGHCDERGTPEYNIALGERRANSVQTYLQNSGVQSSQITVVSYGEEKPVDMSHTRAAYSLNRRAVLAYQQ
jgi:peptidoglycan-associated lipoprotein